MTKTATVHLTKSATLDFVEMRSASHSSSCYRTHTHDEFSFGVVDLGTAEYKNQRQTYKITPGATVTINPGEAHSCNAQQGVWSYRMLFIETAWMGELQREICVDVQQDFQPFGQHLLENRLSYRNFSQLYSCLLTEPSSLIAEEALIAYVAPMFAATATPKKLALGNIAQVQELIMDQLDTNLPLADFCALTNLSPFHLIRSFKHRYGQSPHAYQLDQRIKQARLLLKSGLSLVAIANTLGFADQSHFQRHFKSRTALTPRQYQHFFV